MRNEPIYVENLFFSYDANPVLEDISFSVQPGEFIAIFGPNGGGKTTLLQLLMGFLRPTRGQIQIFGSSPKQARNRIGWVPQNFHFDPHFPISVEEVVLGGRLSTLPWHGHFLKIDQQIVRDVLKQVGMEQSIDRPFATLSGGQQQRVLIARSLASNPSLLLLDEPTASVDTSAENEIFQLLKTLKKQLTIVMVTHNLSRAVNQVDRLFCVQKTLTPMPAAAVCDHFALGLYHTTKEGDST